jgi:hypothetical protein
MYRILRHVSIIDSNIRCLTHDKHLASPLSFLHSSNMLPSQLNLEDLFEVCGAWIHGRTFTERNLVATTQLEIN